MCITVIWYILFQNYLISSAGSACFAKACPTMICSWLKLFHHHPARSRRAIVVFKDAVASEAHSQIQKPGSFIGWVNMQGRAHDTPSFDSPMQAFLCIIAGQYRKPMAAKKAGAYI